MKAIIEAAGSDLSKVVRTSVILTDISHSSVMNEVYEGYFPRDRCPPTRVAFVASTLPLGAMIEIEAIVAL